MKTKAKRCSACGCDKPIWKNSGGKKFCQRCWSAHSATTMPKPTARHKSISPRSAKKIAADKEYSILRKQFLIEHPLCEAHIPGICSQISTDVHHTRGRIGSLHLNVNYWLALCRACHFHIETHPKEARELGFSKTKH